VSALVEATTVASGSSLDGQPLADLGVRNNKI
jgi:hypothetical protein